MHFLLLIYLLQNVHIFVYMYKIFNKSIIIYLISMFLFQCVYSMHTCVYAYTHIQRERERETNNIIDSGSTSDWALAKKEGNILFNDALNTFYLRLYGVRHMVKDHTDS